jgi:hypothetical protein
MVVATGCEEGIHIYNTMMTDRYALPGLHGLTQAAALKLLAMCRWRHLSGAYAHSWVVDFDEEYLVGVDEELALWQFA